MLVQSCPLSRIWHKNGTHILVYPASK